MLDSLRQVKLKFATCTYASEARERLLLAFTPFECVIELTVRMLFMILRARIPQFPFASPLVRFS